MNLQVRDPGGTARWFSSSTYNNYEIVDFTADETGWYTIRVENVSSSEGDNSFGLAWVKDATYLPDLRNKDGWVSELFVHNEGTEPRYAHVHYFDSNGSPTPKGSDVCYLDPNQHCWIPVSSYNRIPAGTTGSAIVDGNEDVSVMVRTLSGSESLAYGGMPAQSALGFQASTRLFFPVYLRDFYNWNSYIDVTNVGTGPTTVKIRFYDEAGQRKGGRDVVLDANESERFPSSIATAATGGVRIVSENPPQPLAAVITQYLNNGPRRGAHAALNVGAHQLYLPSVFRTYYGWECSLNLFNTETQATGDCTVTFYGRDGQEAASRPCDLAGYGSQTIALSDLPLPAGWTGSAVVTADKNLVAAVHQEHAGNNDWQAYRGFSGGAPLSHLPWLRQNSGGWNGSLTVMNVGCAGTTVSVRFYDADGDQVGSRTPWLVRHASREFYSEIPATTRSAVVTTSPSCPVVATVNQITYGISDGGMSYSGFD